MISIIIPTCEASSCLQSLLAKLEAQTIRDLELIVVDSSSEDNTIDIASSYGAKIIIIQRSQFDHGATRTLAAKQAKGDIVIYLTQDALLCDEYAIENIVKPFSKDSQIAAVFGRQLPYPNASIFAQHLRFFNYPDTSYIRVLSDREKHGIKAAFFSDSFSAYKKTALDDVGYFENGLLFGEDTCAAAFLLLKDHKIAYVADAQVFHSHNYTIFQEFRRYFDIGVLHRREGWLLKEFGRAEGQGLKYIKSEIAFLVERKRFDLFPEFALRTASKYLGYKLGGKYIYLPKHVNKAFSMNPQWWNKIMILNQHSISDH